MELSEKFKTTRQEPVRLAAALEGFFQEDLGPGERQEYGRYLRRRIRPAMEALIAGEELEKLEALERQGWFGERELEGFLETARRLEKPAALMWLLHLKNQKYGYREEDFSL